MTLMRCGHAANAVLADGRPVCAICAGLDEGAAVVNDSPPDVTGRMARCTLCGTERPSSLTLPFFEYRADRAKDEFYDGCRGWE